MKMVKNLVFIVCFLFTSGLAYSQSFLSEIRIVEPITIDALADAETNEAPDTSTDVQVAMVSDVSATDLNNVTLDLSSDVQDQTNDTIALLETNINPMGIDKSIPLGINNIHLDLSTDVLYQTNDTIELSNPTLNVAQLLEPINKQHDLSADQTLSEIDINPWDDDKSVPLNSELTNPENEKDIIDSIISFIQDDSSLDEPLTEEFTPIFGFPKQIASIKNELNYSSLLKVELLIENEEFNLALEYLNKLPDHPKTQDEDIVFSILEHRLFLLIKSYFQLADFEKVKLSGRDYIQNFGNGDNFYRTYYYFSAALFELNEPIEYTSLITDDFFNELSSREAHNLRRILIQDAINNNDAIFAFDFLLDVESNLIANYEEWLNQIVDKIEKVQDIDDILDRNIHYSIKSLLYLKKIQLLIRDGQYQEAENFLQVLFTIEELDENTYNRLEELRDYVTVALNTEPHKIGVILPISHKKLLGRLSQEVIDGLELASQEFNVADNPIELVFKDAYIKYHPNDSLRVKRNKTRARIETCIRELVEDDKVIAIVGPITKASSLIAGEVAEKYKIPVISLSQTESIGEKLPFLFRYYRKQTHEAAAIAKYATDYLNARRFVIFYPAGKTEKQIKIVEAFEKVVKERNGQIVGSVRINKKQVDFQEGFLSFTGGLKPLTKEEKEEMEKTRERFQAELDFDAVFIQGSPETLMNISSFLHLYGANHAWILSGSNINIRKNKLLKYTRKLRFVDAFSASSTSTFLGTFYESHWRNFNFRRSYQPPTAYTIFAFETIELLSKLLNDPSFHNRESLRNAVQNLNDFPVLTGKVTTGQDGDLTKDLKILKIERKKTVEVFPTSFN
jgi:ABC-type branched-subunit amino acid transport system substrate-binding protein